MWKADGSWNYVANENIQQLNILVPLADGHFALIEHLPVMTPTKTLGQMTCPMVSSKGAITLMKDKA